MGDVRSRVREITEEERVHLIGRSDAHLLSAVKLRGLRVLEFDVAIDRITKYAWGSEAAIDGGAKHAGEDWRKKIECYVLGIGSGTICFELCFMDWAVRIGSFPSDHVRVAFAVCPSSEDIEKCEELTGASWPVSYHWYGEPIDIKLVSPDDGGPPVEGLLPIYRLRAMREAERCF